MRVCFLLPDLTLSGGVGVVVEHAHHLSADHAFDVTLAVSDGGADGWDYERLDGVRVAAPASLQGERFDVAVATWWRTAYDIFDIDADRHAYFVQSLEDRFYREDGVDRLQAAVTHDLPVAFITEARWIADTLAEWRPDAPCFYVRNGVAKDVFAAPAELLPRTEQPLRILVEGHPDVWFKAVGEALEAAESMTEEREVTLVTPGAGEWPDLGADRVVGPLSRQQMAAEYARTDVVLKLSRIEGMFGPPLEGFHMGATCVVSPVTGHEEYVRHGWNGIVAGWDDRAGTARWLDLLAKDRRLLHYLRYNAAKTAEAWPSWGQSAQFMAAALRSIHEAPMPASAIASAAMARDVLAGTERLRNERIMLQHLVDNAVREYEKVTSTRAHRVGLFLRDRVWKHPLIRLLTLPLRLVRGRRAPRRASRRP